jgi:hypothetical protein
MPELTPEEETAIIAETTKEEEDKTAAEAVAAEEEEVEARTVIEEEDPTAVKEDPAGSVKKTAQERIDEITWKFREAERQANYWKERADGKTPVVEDKLAAKVVSDRPALENFETTVEYEDALFDWRDKKIADATTVEANKVAIKEKVSTFNKNAEEFKKTHKDFNEVIEAPVFTDIMRNVLFTMEGGPEIAYLIAKNPSTGESFNGLSPEQQIFKIAEIRNEVNLTHSSRTITGATGVIEPVGDTGVPEKDPDKMSTDEWMAWNKKRDLAILKKKMGENK